MPRLLGQLIEAERVGILSGGVCQLVDETFDVEAGDAAADRAPEAEQRRGAEVVSLRVV
jgi:hypothetical protein